MSTSSDDSFRPEPLVEIETMSQDYLQPHYIPQSTSFPRARPIDPHRSVNTDQSGYFYPANDYRPQATSHELHRRYSDSNLAQCSRHTDISYVDNSSLSHSMLVDAAREQHLSKEQQDNDGKSSKLPRDWARLKSHYDYVLIRMEKTQADFIRVRNDFVSGGGPDTVAEIFKIQNPDQYRRYTSCRERLQSLADRSYRPETEQTLYYGCDRKNLETVCKTGFTKLLYKGTKYGYGAHFCKRPGYAAHKHSPRYRTGNRFLIQCSVITGNTTLGYKSLRAPLADKKGQECQSAVDRKTNPTNFLIFSEDLVYPKYIIVF